MDASISEQSLGLHAEIILAFNCSGPLLCHAVSLTNNSELSSILICGSLDVQRKKFQGLYVVIQAFGSLQVFLKLVDSTNK